MELLLTPTVHVYGTNVRHMGNNAQFVLPAQNVSRALGGNWRWRLLGKIYLEPSVTDKTFHHHLHASLKG